MTQRIKGESPFGHELVRRIGEENPRFLTSVSLKPI